MPNLNSTISAHIGIAHIEFNEYLDHEAERAASVIDKYIEQMVDAAKGSQHPYQLLHRLYIISNELPKAVGKACYEALHNCGRMSASRVVKALDRAIPRDGGFDVHVKEAVGGAILQAILKPFRKPVARIRNIISDMLIEPIKRSVLERIVLGGAVVISRLMTTVKQAFSPQRVADILVRDISEGKDRRAQITSLRNELAMPRAAAKRTVRTEGIRVATESNMAAYEELGDITIGYAIHALLDEATRPEHRARNGTIYYKYPVGGQKGISEMPRPPIEPDGSISWNCRCHLPGTKIVGNIKSISKADYSGECIEIVTASGIRLTVTANHPICTTDGVRAAASIKEGDSLFSDGGGVAKFADHIEHTPTLVEDAFSTLDKLQPVRFRKQAIPLEFHGDGAMFKSEVEIVSADFCLPGHLSSSRFNGIVQDSFIGRWFSKMSGLDLLGSLFGGHARPLQLLGGVPAPYLDASIEKHSGESVFSPWDLVATGNAVSIRKRLQRFTSQISFNKVWRSFNRFGKLHGFFSAAKDNASGNKLFGKSISLDSQFSSKRSDGFARFISLDAILKIINRLSKFNKASILPAAYSDLVLDEKTANSPSATLEFFAEIKKRCPALVSTDNVVRVRKFHYDGPVYSVESYNGYYIASQEGGYIYNKNCYLSPVFESLENFEMPTSSNVLPSILVYQDWWKNASDAKKRIAVGVRRFNYVTQRYGADASYSHFIDADGQLLSIDTLAAETAEQAAERIAANDALSNEARKRRASLLLTGGA